MRAAWRHLALRDYLRSDAVARGRYASVKRQALAACSGDAHCYAQYKAACVAALEAQALLQLRG